MHSFVRLGIIVEKKNDPLKKFTHKSIGCSHLLNLRSSHDRFYKVEHLYANLNVMWKLMTLASEPSHEASLCLYTLN